LNRFSHARAFWSQQNTCNFGDRALELKSAHRLEAIVQPMTAPYSAKLRALLRFFRLESKRLQLPQGVRAALGISVPIGLGLAFHQLAAAVIVTFSAWLVLLADTGGAYRQKAIATLSATVGVVGAVLGASILNVSPLSIVVGTFLWVAAAAFLGIYGNTASTVSFLTSLMFIITAALPHGSDLWFRLFLCVVGGLWAACLSLALWPLHAFTPVIEAVVQSYTRLADLLEAACSVQLSGPDEPSIEDPFPDRYEAVVVSLENARKIWTAVRVGRAGPSARSSQLLTLIENAAQLSSVAVALHEEMLPVRTHPRFADVSREVAHEKIELVRITQTIAAAIAQRGGNIDVRDLEQADRSLQEAIERLRSETFTEIHDFSVLVHIGKLSRGFTAVLDLLRANAEIVANLRTGRLTDSVRAATGPPREHQSTRFWAILRSNLTFQSVTFRHAVRLGTAAAIATAIAKVAHLPRGYWVVVTVLVVLKPNFGGTIERVIQRIAGTIVGGVIALLINIFVRDERMLFLCIALLAFTSFSIRAFGFGFFTLVVTPLFMVLMDLANPSDWAVSLFRILDTLIGGILALIGGYALFPIWERQRLPSQLARTLIALKEYFDDVTGAYVGKDTPAREIERVKRQAALEIANATAASQRLLSEPSHVRGDIEPTLSAVNYARHFFLAVGALDEHFHEFPGHGEWQEVRAFAEAVSSQLNNLALVLQTGATLNAFPDLDLYVDRLGENVERLSGARLEEFSADLKKEVTSTLLALREQSIVHVQLKRIASHLRILQNAVGRLKNCPAETARAEVSKAIGTG
jgi:uncharacterized membrane protein YccC